MMVPTPYSLLNSDTPRDVFLEIFPQYIDPDDPQQGENPYWSIKRNTMWAMYHDTGIGNTDVDYWVRCMQTRKALIDVTYNAKIKALENLLTSIDNNGPDYSASSLQSQSVQRAYDPPEVTISQTRPIATDFLSDQNITDFNQSSKTGLETETVRQWADGIPAILEDYAREFSKLFYWGI